MFRELLRDFLFDSCFGLVYGLLGQMSSHDAICNNGLNLLITSFALCQRA